MTIRKAKWLFRTLCSRKNSVQDLFILRAALTSSCPKVPDERRSLTSLGGANSPTLIFLEKIFVCKLCTRYNHFCLCTMLLMTDGMCKNKKPYKTIVVEHVLLLICSIRLLFGDPLRTSSIKKKPFRNLLKFTFPSEDSSSATDPTATPREAMSSSTMSPEAAAGSSAISTMGHSGGWTRGWPGSGPRDRDRDKRITKDH